MQMIFCPNCGKRSGFKRALGFGTFFMVVITFGLWLFMIPLYPARCINCGETRGSANWQNASRTGKIVIACAWVCIVLFILHAMRDNTQESTEPNRNTAALPVLDPHESRLVELRKKREGIGAQIAIELEVAKQLVLDAANLSTQPFPDPGEHQFLIDKMDQQHQRLAELEESKNAIDAEIATEEGSQQPNSELPSVSEPPSQAAGQPADIPQSIASPSSSTATNPAPPVEIGKPTSGVLCNGTIAVPQNGELTFKNLPGDRLKFTFDHDAWQPRIRRQPDGTQTLVMRSLKPGTQTKCDMQWEIAQ
ncbi:MAG: hypothetical protein ABSG65_35140 [Bryobacteraceae bacterium]|jgi:hypothetical protein